MRCSFNSAKMYTKVIITCKINGLCRSHRTHSISGVMISLLGSTVMSNHAFNFHDFLLQVCFTETKVQILHGLVVVVIVWQLDL